MELFVLTKHTGSYEDASSDVVGVFDSKKIAWKRYLK